MAPLPKVYVRPAAAMPRMCVVCGGSSDLAWHPFAFQFATAIGAIAIFVGIMHTFTWQMQLPACGRCRARSRWGSLIMLGSVAAGVLVSMLILFLLTVIGVGGILGFALVLAPALAGFYAGNRLRGRTRPRLVRAAREELTIAIPGRGPLRLAHTDPAKVDAPLEPAAG